MDGNQVVGLGRKIVDYVSNNAAEITATAGVTAGWAGAAVFGGPKIVGTICLVGGGMFATIGEHEVVTQGIKVSWTAIKGARENLRRSFAKQTHPEPHPNLNRIDVPGTASG